MVKVKEKILEWTKRYGLAEIVGMSAAYGGFFVSRDLDSLVASVYSSTLASNVGYYGTMIFTEAVKDLKENRKIGENYGVRGISKTGLKLIGEFGIGEVLDSTLVRPVLVGSSVELFGENLGIGIGTIAANVSFYLPTIVSYELIKKLSK